MKKIIRGVMIISLALFLLFLANACAKKQFKTESEVIPVTKAPPAVESREAGEAARKKAEAEEAVKKKAEAEEAAKLREKEMAQKFLEEAQAFESEKIYFDFDKSDLKPEARAILDKKAAWLRANPEYPIRIEGNCDERGTIEYNLALGERRAFAAKDYLVALGISGDRIATLSYGEERPADPGHNEQAWAKNRRDEFKLLK
jgi:peptidoglycan-associated lipoprotein